MLYVSLMNDRRSNNINYTKRNSKPYFSNKYRTKPVSNLLRAEAAGIYIQILKNIFFRRQYTQKSIIFPTMIPKELSAKAM